MLTRRMMPLFALVVGLAQPALADPPTASYIFPAGGQRGTTVEVRVGGLNLYSRASFEMLGPGIEAPGEIHRGQTAWLEGPLLPLPDSQLAEDYPKDYSGRVAIASDAPTGPRTWRIWTSQGASGSLPFVVGDLPEVVEHEADGDLVSEAVTLPVTINGRIFPREDVDRWSFTLRAGEVVTGTVAAARLGSSLDPWLEALDPDGRRLAESAPAPSCDARIAFVAPRNETYTVKIHDVAAKGGQAYIYRLTLTTGPSVAQVFPLGGRRGSVLPFTLAGLGVPARSEPVTLPCTRAGHGPDAAVVRFRAGGSAIVEVDDLPEALEAEPNDQPVRATRMGVPGVGDGRIDRAGDVDIWTVPLLKGHSYTIDLRSARLGSRLDGLLALNDASGKELVRAEGTAARGGDPALTFIPSADGEYTVRVQDRFRSSGGPDWPYRLRVADAPAPDFRLIIRSDTLSVPRGGTAKFPVEVERIGGFAGPITLEVDGMPAGTSSTPTTIAANAGSAEVTIKAEPKAPIRSARLSVRGKGRLGDRTVERVATQRQRDIELPEIDSIRLAVALPTPFQISGLADFGWSPRGTVRHRRYRIARNGFTGPIEVQLADRQARHLQGITGPVMDVPPGADEFDYFVTLPPRMEMGRTSRSVVMATAVVREPDGSEHEVGFSSPVADLQVISVIGPGLLGLEARRTSLAVAPGRISEVPVKVARARAVDGPVRVELAATGRVPGLSAEPLILERGQDEGVLRIVCGPSFSCPRTASIVIRAGAVVAGDPVTAEAMVSVVADPSTDPGQ